MPASLSTNEQNIMCRLNRTGAFKSMAVFLAAVAPTGCSPSYSPNSYASNATQIANKVDQGIVVGVRAVLISADASLGTGTGAAAGGIAGSQIGSGAAGAFGALTGSVAGGVVGNVVSHAAGDTDGFEYIVRKTNAGKATGDLMSVTQKDVSPLGVGAHVLIIEGPQARIVADYTVPVVVQSLHPEAPKSEAPKAIEAAPLEAPAPKAADAPAKSEPAFQPVATPLPLPPPAAAPVSAEVPKVADAAAKPESAGQPAPSQPVATPLPPPAAGQPKPADSVAPPAKTEDGAAAKPSGS
jgi:outer membrane lipoprotein SlyB